MVHAQCDVTVRVRTCTRAQAARLALRPAAGLRRPGRVHAQVNLGQGERY